MTDSTPSGTEPETAAPQRPHVARRHYLIDRKRQLRTAFLTTSLVAVLLILVNLGFTLLRTSQTSFLAASAPQLKQVLEKQDSTFSLIMVVTSVVLVIAVAFATVLQTHRTAGAVYAVKQRLQRVADGDLQVRLKLRQRDNLQDLEEPFNAMMATLRKRELDEAAALDELAATAAEAGPEGRMVATALAELATRKRQLGT